MKLAVDIKNVYFTNNPGANYLGRSPAFLFQTLLPNAIIAAGIIFLFLIMFAGFKMITSAGSGGSPQDAAKAKSAMTWGVVGFLIVAMSYFILQIVGAFFGFSFNADYLLAL